ncbi:MAG: hypothetical protein KDD02_04310 [Phaeodactylibacter sp.]|nr:hypothetical protein [Phaeodactylibacter sp.]MCB9302199.1 hypothetical protein [Lewinellaceae bacterium]HQU59040.1 hypothetical protein [Saprospiraceae bacterium]
MQRDHLEQFVLDNREAFDDAIPGLQVWGGITRELDKRRRRRLIAWRITQIAAAISILLVCGALLGEYAFNLRGRQTASLEQIAPHYAELEAYYQKQIQQRSTQLASYSYDASVERDLSQLDKAMQELREELAHAPKGSEEEIIENLIKNYKAKAAILERVLDRLKTAEPGEEQPEEEHEQVSI